ncbi:MAG TPA: signal peptide peptidase SppA [Anaerolineae bacterium]|nr:signal peptide peptidase SppA [Anaerolineae bacterium]
MKKSKWLWVGVGLGSVLCFLIPLGCLGISMLSLAGGPSTGNIWEQGVVVIRIEGVIVSGKEPDWALTTSDNAYSESIIERLERADSDPAVKAVVLRVNSPGGGIVATDEIYTALKELGKPVVASMGEMAASGGYYVSCAAREIIANPATLTGSIGVISTVPNFEELLDKIGIEMLVIKSGTMKDELSPYREPTAEEIAHWQAITDEAYEQFLGVVVEERDLDPDEAREMADGRVYTGQQALDLGLVDRLGNLPDAIQLAAELGGIEGEPRVIEYQRTPSLMEMLLSGLGPRPTSLSVEELLGIERRFTVQYLYVSP